MDSEAAKRHISHYIDSVAGELCAVSRSIHARPELAFEEHHAHDVLTTVLTTYGLDTESAAFGLPTAFRAEAGQAGPRVAVLCEYDALPGIGHACGHNVIAAAGLGAGLVLASLAEDLGGRVVVLGTPAEEGGGGKITMAERGAFVNVDAAMMVHPADSDLSWMTTIALERLTASYTGLAAHAAAMPWAGRNALDAAVLGYMNVAALRQHIAPDERVHGIFTNGGGQPNIVPSSAETSWYVRSPTLDSLQPLKARVVSCLEAGAHAAACGCTLTWGDSASAYSDLRTNEPMAEAFTANGLNVGREFSSPNSFTKVVGSTDMGNVSYLVPSIHPMIKVAPQGTAIHSAAFAGYAGGEEGDRAVIDAAKVLAMTVVDLWLDSGLRQRSATAFTS